MSDALEDGLRGVAPDPTDATAALDRTAATRMLGDMTGATRAEPRRTAERTRRPLEPLDEPARRRPPARAPAPAPQQRQRERPRKKRSPFRAVFGLILLLGVIVLGVATYQLVQDNTNRAVQLRENVRGGVQDAVDEIQGVD